MEAAGIKGGSAFGSGTIDGFKTEEEHIKDTLNNITEDLFRRIDQTILDSANKSGKKTGEGIADGIKDSTPQTLKATSDMAEGVMKLLPHNSPAEQGPLSELDKVGPALIDTIAEGVKKSAKALETEVIRAFDVVFKELDNVTEAIENLPPVNIETKQSIKNLQNLSKALETLPETKDIFVNVQNNQALNEIQRVKDKLDSIPQVTTKQLVIQAKTQASPIMDFTKGVNYMDERLNKLVTPREMLIQADLPSRLSPADPRFTDVGRPQAKIKQDVAINVNVKVDKLDVGRHNIDMIAADIGRTIARDINNDRGDMPKAIRTVAMRV
jgi:BMFP domain-containing protein YqiC